MFRRKQTEYTFNLYGRDHTLSPGDSLSVEPLGVTIWCGEDGVFDVCPLMTDEQMSERTDREIRAKYNLHPCRT